MSELGDLLALLHEGPPRVRTLVAEIRRRTDSEASLAAWQARAKGESFVVAYEYRDGEDDEPEPERRESLTRIWVDLERRLEREETTGDDAQVAVRRGSTWWRWDEETGSMSNEADPNAGTSVAEDRKWILGGLPLLSLLRLEVLARAEVGGRPTWRCRATPRPEGTEDNGMHDWALHDLPAYGAEEYTIDVDAQTGLVLRVAGVFEGAEFSVTEVTDLIVDEPIEEERFVFRSPDGSPVRGMEDLHPRPHFHLSPSKLAALANFALFAPARVPDDWEVTFGYVEAGSRRPQRAQAMIMLRSKDNLRDIQINQTPVEGDAPYDEWDHARPAPWQHHEADGIDYEWRNAAEDWQPARVRFERDGTRVLIDSSHLEAAELLDLALGMVPLRTDPPDFT